MNPYVLDLITASPEVLVLAMGCLILILDLFVKDPAHTSTFVITQLTLVGAAILTLFTSTGEVVYAFNGLYVDDLMGDLLKLVLYLTAMVTLFYARPYVLQRPDLRRGEFYVLVLFATLGMMVMISANHLLTIYLGVELLTLSTYALIAMNRDSVSSTEAAMKYFVLGALASGLLLYGMSMIYGATGTLSIPEILDALVANAANPTVLIFGLVFIVSGLAFKLGVVPFHMWVPDVYQGAPTPITMLIGGAPKLAAFAITMRLLVSGLLLLAPDWQGMLLILAVLSLAIGNLAAIPQTNIKRMLAYSTISHMGFVLLGIVVGVVGGDARFALNAYSSSMFYVVSYVMMSVAAFGEIILLSCADFEADRIDDFKGLNKRNPWFAAVMMMIMFSMAGVPFFIGFFAKFSILQAVVASGQIGLAIYAVLMSLIGAFYYLRIVKVMYFDEPIDESPIEAPTDMRVLLSINGLAIALFGLFPQTIMSLCAFSLLRSL
ncbi:MAG: NADH-ubiquinone oxidoreductase chain N [Fluviibacter phosphoraccumulans EoVTN8]